MATATFDPFHEFERLFNGVATAQDSSLSMDLYKKGDEVEWIVEDMVQEPGGGSVTAALDAWRELVDGPPRIGRAVFSWERP